MFYCPLAVTGDDSDHCNDEEQLITLRTRFWWTTGTTTEMKNAMRMHNPAHPGEVLREFLPEHMTVAEAARRLKVSRVQLSRLLNGRAAMTAEMAIRAALFIGTTPESWLANQMHWDLWRASRRRRPAIARAA